MSSPKSNPARLSSAEAAAARRLELEQYLAHQVADGKVKILTLPSDQLLNQANIQAAVASGMAEDDMCTRFHCGIDTLRDRIAEWAPKSMA